MIISQPKLQILFKKIYWFLFVYDLDGAGEQTPVTKQPSSAKGRLMQELSYLVLFAYTFFIVAPLMPMVTDLLAHTFWEQEHLSTAHHRYGQHHVSIEIQQAEKRADTNAASHTVTLDDLVHRPERYVQFEYTPVAAVKTTYSLFTCSYTCYHPDIDYPPPRV